MLAPPAGISWAAVNGYDSGHSMIRCPFVDTI